MIEKTLSGCTAVIAFVIMLCHAIDSFAENENLQRLAAKMLPGQEKNVLFEQISSEK